MSDLPKQLGYRMPAEWEPHEGTWLSWPHNPRTWVGNFGPIPAVFAEIVRALCERENVHICVRDGSSEASVLKLLQGGKVDCANVRFYHIPTNDAWARDHGPIFIRRDGKAQSLPLLEAAENQSGSSSEIESAPIAIVDWKFNSWGEKYPPWDDDDAVPEKVAAILKMPCYHPRVVLEGGSIEVNGNGTVLTTESVLLNPNRNPSLSKKQIEARLDEYLAARNVIWLGDGIAGDDTDGHIDDLSRFVNPTTVVTVVEDDSEDINYKALHENYERLQSARDQDGAKLEIVKLPTPGKVFRGAVHADRPAEERLPASYANFYIGNGAVLVPVFGHANDKKALGLLSDFFPGRKVVGIQCKDLVGGYGAIHCVTQQQPL
jgi:agmatine deiminase